MNFPRGAVVVGVDSSSNSDRALLWAAQDVELRRAPLHLLHAVPRAGAELAFTTVEELTRQRKPAYRVIARTCPVAKRLTSAPISVRVAFDQEPTTALIEASAHAEFIAVGGRDRDAGAIATSDSVSLRISTLAHCPVVVVHDLPAPRTRRVILALEESPSAARALSYAIEVAARDDAPLTIFSRGAEPFVPTTARCVTTYSNVEVIRQAAHSDPVQALVTTSRNASLIILTRSARDRSERVQPRAAVEAVLRGAHCPVMVVP